MNRGGRIASPPRLTIAAPLALEALALRAGMRGEAAVVRTGMGPERARAAVARLSAGPAEAFAVAGLCGALTPDLAPGEVVVASRLVADGAPPIELDAAPVVAALGAQGLPARSGVIASAGRLVAGEERERLAAQGAVAVDMESFWLASAARGRPFAVLRVVVDGPRHELWRAGIARRGLAGLWRLRRAAPALARWAAAQRTLLEPDQATRVQHALA